MPGKGATINLEYDVLESEASTIYQCGEEINSIGAEVQSICEELASNWIGEASYKFQEVLNDCAVQVFPAMSQLCQEMSATLNATAANMKAADASIGSAASSALKGAMDSVFGN